MPQLYRQIVSELRQAFPQPLPDGAHNAGLGASIRQALDQIDVLKSTGPVLGIREELDYAGARARRIGEQPLPLEQVIGRLVEYLSGMIIGGHPRTQINLDPAPTIPSIIGGLLPSLSNPNLVGDDSSRQVAVAEVEAASIAAALVGYDPRNAGGVFTFGGTGTTLYGVKLGLEKCCPGTMQNGLRMPARIICSERAHYAARTVAGWLGLGFDSLVEVPCDRNHELRTCLFETMCRDLLKRGERVAAMIATVGTTDAFGLDNVREMVEIRNRLTDEFALDYVPHIHADAVVGWAWSVFNDYDFERNPLEFPGRTNEALAGIQRRVQHLGLADSIGIDFHKTGFTSYISSLFLSRDRTNFELLAQTSAAIPYFIQAGHYQPGQFTLETSRAGGGPMAALANLLLFGKNGLRALLGHLVTMAETLRERLTAHSAVRVLNCGNSGLVTLFRIYPDGVDVSRFPEREQTDPACRDKLREYNDYNRRLFQLTQAEALQGRGIALSLTDGSRRTAYGEPVVALKSYIMSPFTDDQHIASLLDSIREARAIAGREPVRNRP
jgi:glutamate/tyrosine decarboxylase-like PLP-dependent enzyme